MIHRDYLSLHLTITISFIALGSIKVNSLNIISRKKQIYPVIFLIVLILAILILVWIMVVSYTIMLRWEPRWIESTAYNVMNLVLTIQMLWAALILKNSLKKRLRVRKNKITLDALDISAILSFQEQEILLAFLRTPERITCYKLVSQIRGEQESCLLCQEKNLWSPSKCSVYRNIKNRVLDCKKFVELLQIGSIVPGAKKEKDINKREQGWQLRLFDDIELEDR